MSEPKRYGATAGLLLCEGVSVHVHVPLDALAVQATGGVRYNVLSGPSWQPLESEWQTLPTGLGNAVELRGKWVALQPNGPAVQIVIEREVRRP